MLIENIKMASHLTYMLGSLLFVLYATGSLVLCEIGCPPAENITPCICDDRASTRLVCSYIYHPDALKDVFKNSARYTFQEVHIKSTTAMYLHSMMFEKARINELYVENSNLVSLFDYAPNTRTLEKLQLDNTTFQRGLFSSDVLKRITSLKTLIVRGYKALIKLDSTFKSNLPSDLKEIILRDTGIQQIVPGAFSGFLYLDKLEVSNSKLGFLTRDMFPRPFNVRFLYFDNNKINNIPRDLFTDMPELQFLTMKNNYITEVPEAAFGNRRTSIPYLRFDGNPLQCNCLLVWLVKKKPEVIGGTCHTPRNLRGKQLQDLLPGDFNCY